jgi:superfamily II DNA or RNA helicase
LKLRKWQEGALSASLGAIEKLQWGVVSAATGTGKSVVIASICASLQGRILITVPNQYLINQLSLDLQKMCDPSEIGLYYQHEKNISKRITICTLQSLSLLVQEKLFEPLSLWIADEVHKTETQIIIQSVLDLMRPMTAIGFTATPFRADRKEEISLFTHNIFTYSIQDGIKDGVLVPY